MTDLTHPIFHDETKARTYFEKLRWPDGPVCPHCQSMTEIGKVHRKIRKPRNPTKKHRPQREGLYYCGKCDQQFSVTVGTVMERSHIPINKWLLGFVLLSDAKKSISAKQLERHLDVNYRTAWFMGMRIREAMRDPNAGPLGGEGKIIESDETFVGGKKKNVHKGKPEPKKHAVQALVERGGKMRARHVADVTGKTLRETLVTQASRKSELHTDDALAYLKVGKEFTRHRIVTHGYGEYVSKDGEAHVQSAESFFAIFKRGITGSFHSVSEAHLQRYCDEFQFRFNNRQALGVTDLERANRALKGAEGKRLTYKRTDEAKDA